MAFATATTRLNLIFDADDTLWDSNIHFLEAEEAFIGRLKRVGITEDGLLRDVLRRHELSIIAEAGYGRAPFVEALHRAAAELALPHHHAGLSNDIAQIGETLMNRRCELLPGVAETLAILAGRHRLLLFTKGQPGDQLAKLEQSGLRGFFSRIGIPREKDAGTYRLLVAQAELEPAHSVMIGNSPRSDINPAL